MADQSGTLRIIMEAPDGSMAVDAPVEAIADDPTKLAAHIVRLEAQGFVIKKDDATGADLPNERAGESRKFRNCWRWDGAKIETDLPLARAEIMVAVRAERNERINATDGMQLRANEIGSAQDKTDWNDHRQALRDVPATVQGEVDVLTTAADLEAHAVSWPTEPGA